MEGLDGWKAQLNEFLESYTKGLAREIVDSRGQHGALDAWGSLKDRAESIREEHLQHYLLKAYNPKTAVAAKNLETTIAAWEADVRSYQSATGEKFPEANRKILLVNMCPEKLRDYLRAMERSRVSSYEFIKREIVDWLMDEVRRNKNGGRAAALGEKSIEGIYEEEVIDVDWDAEEDNMSHGQLLALVKNAKLKGQKGKGKGKGKVKTCYECGAEGHIASDCSVRKERVAAGGPERLPPEDVQMGGGKGGKAIGKCGKGGNGGVKGGDGKGSFGKGGKG